MFGFRIVSFHVFTFSLVLGSHIPDIRDEGVELIREKRDSFFDRILKSIPFFHMSSPPNIMEEGQMDQYNDTDDFAADDNDGDQISSSSGGEMDTNTYHTNSLVTSSLALSAMPTKMPTAYTKKHSKSMSMSEYFSVTPTVSINSESGTENVTRSNITVASNTVQSVVSITTSMIKGDFSESVLLPSQHAVNGTFPNYSIYKRNHSTSPIARVINVSDIAKETKSNITKSKAVDGNDSTEPVIKMMIMSGESPLRIKEYGPHIIDGTGFGDNLGIQQIGEDIDVKNIRFMYASVLVPVMSGLIGALVITFGILIFRCIKRKKLKRVRYYGAKPGFGLYRLDQMGLLSDMSSDEE